ncbi:uncharacterized [Tachysurus ichikawai]
MHAELSAICRPEFVVCFGVPGLLQQVEGVWESSTSPPPPPPPPPPLYSSTGLVKAARLCADVLGGWPDALP